MNSAIIYCMIIVCFCVVAKDLCLPTKILSDFNQTVELVVPTCRIYNIRLEEEISYLRCRYNYGHQGPVVWVKDGCKGKFLICYKIKPRDDSEMVTCTGKGYTECSTALSNLYWVDLVQSFSSMTCIRGHYGITGNKIWIKSDCQGTFRVYGLKNDEC